LGTIARRPIALDEVVRAASVESFNQKVPSLVLAAIAVALVRRGVTAALLR
jgi:hypothetical protein